MGDAKPCYVVFERCIDGLWMNFDGKALLCPVKGGKRRVRVRCGMARGNLPKQLLTFVPSVAQAPEGPPRHSGLCIFYALA